MTHIDIIKSIPNRYSYTDFLKACAAHEVDACSANEWGNALQTVLVEEQNAGFAQQEPAVIIMPESIQGCKGCGGGKVR